MTRLLDPPAEIPTRPALRERLAAAIREARRDLGWTQRRLATASGVAQSQVAEAEHAEGGSVETMERILTTLGGRITVNVQRPVILGAGDGADVVHRTGVGTIGRILGRAGFGVALEQPVRDGPVRGWIDLLGFEATSRRLLVIEFKSELSNLGATLRQVDLYARTCLQPARALGWRPTSVQVALIVLGTATTDAFVTANRADLGAAFPLRGRSAVGALLGGGPASGRALLALDPTRPGRLALGGFHVDGRRAPFRLAHAGELRSTLEAGAAGQGRRSRRRD